MRLTTIFILVLIAVVVLELSEAAKSRRRSSTTSSSRRRASSSRRRSSSNSGGSQPSKPKITKYTPIKPETVRSPVIVRQTKQGSRSSAFTTVVVSYLALHYALSTAPVYRQGYPMYRNYVSIPKNRAVRLSYEEEKLMDSQGNFCWNDSTKIQTLREGIDDDLIELNTTVIYKNTGNNVKLHGINNTISLEDVKGEDFEVTSRARYNDSIVEGTNCSLVEKRIEGTMVEMYQTNPNNARTVHISYKLLLASITMAGFIALFKTA